MAKRVTGNTSFTPSPSSAISPTIFPGRVVKIILDDTTYSDDFKRYGEWASIGLVFFQNLSIPEGEIPSLNKAFPLFPNQKIYPLLNEVIYIISLPSTELESKPNSQKYYYFQPINFWSSNHHNAIPDGLTNIESVPDYQKQDYQQTEAGAVRRVSDGGTEINLGQTFKENLTIKPLQPFEGDIIHEGRFGQSLRFGSTVPNSNIPNPWSSTGENGDPITILRNTQYEDGKDPWIPQVEDINKEGSSIYFTSTQNIPIEVSSKSYNSYSTPPTIPNKFAGEQIILNSGRLLFNSKTDSILFSSADTINLNAVNSVNIDAPKTVIQSKEVLLGDKNARESVILGDKFLNDLSKLLTQIIALGTALQVPVGTPVPFVPHAAIPVPAVNVTQTATQMLNSIQTYKSKVSKTK